MAYVDAMDFFARVEEQREKQYGPANPRDFVLLLAAARPPEDAIPDYDRVCAGCGCGIEKGEVVCKSCHSQKRMVEIRMCHALGIRCIDCGEDISGRRGQTVRCRPCATKHHVKQQRASARRLEREKPKKPRLCEDCGADISERANNAKLCEACARVRQRAAMREYQRRQRAVGKQEAVA